MSITDDELQAARGKPAYKAGIWAFRVMLAVLVLQIALTAAGIVPGRVAIWFLLAYLAAAICGYVLFDRAGVRVVGVSDGIWGRRKMVYKDVFGLGRNSSRSDDAAP